MKNKMKIIKRIKLARIAYGELEVGDEYKTFSRIQTYTKGVNYVEMESGIGVPEVNNRALITALDHVKYPPESVTWDVTGISDDDVFVSSRGDVLFNDALSFKESEIETIYE
tara:strand:+ start:18310 stop:18645 length:336 start_codon:yes stop_codon:yes gene_type:complete